MNMDGYSFQDRMLFPNASVTDQIILMWEILQFLGWKEVQRMKNLIPNFHVPSLFKKMFSNLVFHFKAIRKTMLSITLSGLKKIEGKQSSSSSIESINFEDISSDRVLTLEAEIEVLKSQLNTIMKIINKDEDSDLFKNLSTQGSNHFSSSMPLTKNSFYPDFDNNFIQSNHDSSSLAPMAKNSPPPPPLPDFFKEILNSGSRDSSMSTEYPRETSSVSKALFEEMKSIKLKTVSSPNKSSMTKHINDDYDYLRKALDDKFKNVNFDDFSRDSTTWDE